MRERSGVTMAGDDGLLVGSFRVDGLRVGRARCSTNSLYPSSATAVTMDGCSSCCCALISPTPTIQLLAGTLLCGSPACAGVLRPWGHARFQSLRDGDGSEWACWGSLVAANTARSCSLPVLSGSDVE